MNLAIWRGSTTQVLSLPSLFGVQTEQSGMRDDLGTTVDADLLNIKPLRKWLKAHVENKKIPQVQGRCFYELCSFAAARIDAELHSPR